MAGEKGIEKHNIGFVGVYFHGSGCYLQKNLIILTLVAVN